MAAKPLKLMERTNEVATPAEEPELKLLKGL
jgi:hypothetical protein